MVVFDKVWVVDMVVESVDVCVEVNVVILDKFNGDL